jgi:uncharacterized phage-associated protein
MPNTNYRKITQALNYLATKNPDKKINKLKAIKLVWIADRYHLRKYGRPITWDTYEAMPLGPVGSITKDIAEQTVFLEDGGKSYSSKYIQPISKYEFGSKSAPDVSVFSESDLSALEFAYNKYGSWDKYKLKDLTHRYPEWKKFEELLKSGMIIKAKMDYLDFFDNPADNETDVFDDDKDLVETSKEIFLNLLSLKNAHKKEE